MLHPCYQKKTPHPLYKVSSGLNLHESRWLHIWKSSLHPQKHVLIGVTQYELDWGVFFWQCCGLATEKRLTSLFYSLQWFTRQQSPWLHIWTSSLHPKKHVLIGVTQYELDWGVFFCQCCSLASEKRLTSLFYSLQWFTLQESPWLHIWTSSLQPQKHLFIGVTQTELDWRVFFCNAAALLPKKASTPLI